MLEEVGLPRKYWADAVNTACHTQNRSMLTKHHGKTPYELWNNRKPSISYFRSFGCKCFIHNNGKVQLKAFESKADEGIFLGYSSVSRCCSINKPLQKRRFELTINLLANSASIQVRSFFSPE
ncbi:hypothetical protein ACS0TY_032553 [Phlomoides rotata]